MFLKILYHRQRYSIHRRKDHKTSLVSWTIFLVLLRSFILCHSKRSNTNTHSHSSFTDLQVGPDVGVFSGTESSLCLRLIHLIHIHGTCVRSESNHVGRTDLTLIEFLIRSISNIDLFWLLSVPWPITYQDIWFRNLRLVNRLLYYWDPIWTNILRL